MPILLSILGLILCVSLIIRIKSGESDSVITTHTPSNYNGLTQYRIVSPDGKYRYLEYLTSNRYWKPVPKIQSDGCSAEDVFSFDLYTHTDFRDNVSRPNYYLNNSDILLEQFTKSYPNIEVYLEKYKTDMLRNKVLDKEYKKEVQLRKENYKQIDYKV